MHPQGCPKSRGLSSPAHRKITRTPQALLPSAEMVVGCVLAWPHRTDVRTDAVSRIAGLEERTPLGRAVRFPVRGQDLSHRHLARPNLVITEWKLSRQWPLPLRIHLGILRPS